MYLAARCSSSFLFRRSRSSLAGAVWAPYVDRDQGHPLVTPNGGRMQTSGGPRNSAPGTLTRLFFDAVQKYDRPDALQYKEGGAYKPISHRELADRVRRTALGLQELGL